MDTTQKAASALTGDKTQDKPSDDARDEASKWFTWPGPRAKALAVSIDAFVARKLVEERERCAKVCFAVEEELLAVAERYHEARRTTNTNA
jgi:hypothetical protein